MATPSLRIWDVMSARSSVTRRHALNQTINPGHPEDTTPASKRRSRNETLFNTTPSVMTPSIAMTPTLHGTWQHQTQLRQEPILVFCSSQGQQRQINHQPTQREYTFYETGSFGKLSAQAQALNSKRKQNYETAFLNPSTELLRCKSHLSTKLSIKHVSSALDRCSTESSHFSKVRNVTCWSKSSSKSCISCTYKQVYVYGVGLGGIWRTVLYRVIRFCMAIRFLIRG